MKYLIPVGGAVDWRTFAGILTSPAHRGIPRAIQEGALWAADNQCFTKGWQPDRFLPWLETLKPYRDQCLFVTMPDVAGDATATLQLWPEWHDDLKEWPLALVAQDGLTVTAFGVLCEEPFGDETEMLDDDSDEAFYAAWLRARGFIPWPVFTTLFIGGSTDWKLSDLAQLCIHTAYQHGKHIHVGRVNWRKRYRHFATLPGAETFTCDGTRMRFDGRHHTLLAWQQYQTERAYDLR